MSLLRRMTQPGLSQLRLYGAEAEIVWLGDRYNMPQLHPLRRCAHGLYTSLGSPRRHMHGSPMHLPR